MDRSPGVRHLLAAALTAALAHVPAARAQGGWPQWDVVLRDGRRVEANPLGAPDDAHVAISVGGMEGHDTTIARARVAYLAARPAPGTTLPPRPAGRACEDAVVRLDGRRTIGRVTLARVAYSQGVVRQRGADVDLRDVAYLTFARPCRAKGPPP